MKIEIVGLSKADVLLNLYNNAKFAGEGFASQPMMKVMYRMNPFGKSEAADAAIEKAIKNNDFYFDYIDLGAGPRPLKVDLSGFDFDSTNYDRNHGHDGYAAEIIDRLRAAVIEQCKDAPKDSIGFLLSQIGLAFKAKTDSKKSDDSAHAPESGPSA